MWEHGGRGDAAVTGECDQKSRVVPASIGRAVTTRASRAPMAMASKAAVIVLVTATAVLGSLSMGVPAGAAPAPTGPPAASTPSTAATAIAAATVSKKPQGYWLVGRDGGIFSFGAAGFYGSTGALHLQRPVVGMTPTADHRGYWLVAADGGIFAFGDAGFYGSIPGIGLAPAGSNRLPRLNAPIVGMVPSVDGGGYFMVATDGGVFAFGDAQFEGSCPGVGGCRGSAKVVMPDAVGNGYWVVTTNGHVHSFGNAPNYGEPGPKAVLVSSAARTPSGHGYWILYRNGVVFHYGQALNYGSLPAGDAGGYDIATAIFPTATAGYWIATAAGAVYPFGDATFKGDMAGHHLNGSIIAAVGF